MTGPTALPIAARPGLKIQFGQPGTLVLSWLANDGAFVVQQNDVLRPSNWFDIFGGNPTYTSGRNILEVMLDPFSLSEFFRLRSQ